MLEWDTISRPTFRPSINEEGALDAGGEAAVELVRDKIVAGDHVRTGELAASIAAVADETGSVAVGPTGTANQIKAKRLAELGSDVVTLSADDHETVSEAMRNELERQADAGE